MNTKQWIDEFRHLSGVGLIDSNNARKVNLGKTPEEVWEACGGKVPKSVQTLEEEMREMREVCADAANKLSMLGKEFSSSNFTDRHGDGPECIRLAERLRVWGVGDAVEELVSGVEEGGRRSGRGGAIRVERAVGADGGARSGCGDRVYSAGGLGVGCTQGVEAQRGWVMLRRAVGWLWHAMGWPWRVVVRRVLVWVWLGVAVVLIAVGRGVEWCGLRMVGVG